MDITTTLEAVFLGFIEGLTEFIPVSSTGHLILAIDLMGFKGPPGKVFEIAIQLGAILAVCWAYKEKLFKVVLGLPKEKAAQHFTLNLIVAFVPAVVVGVLAHGFIKAVLFNPWVVSVSLIVGGFIILLIESMTLTPRYKDVDTLPGLTAFKIGCCQVIAMIPGVSRSGATIMGSLLLGVDRQTATQFSFFLAIPTMLGATVYDLYKNLDYLDTNGMAMIALGFVTAFFAALMVVKALIAFISKHGFKPFAWYRIAIGALMLTLLIVQG